MSDAPVFIGGHSLGGARAIGYAWSRVKRGLRVDGIYAFEPPRFGDHSIGVTLATVPIKISTWNRRDPVVAVPIDLEILNEEYEQPWHPIELNEAPPPNDDWGWLRDHHMFLCQDGVRKLPPIGGAIELVDAADAVQHLYDSHDGWNWINPVDGEFWAMKIFPSGAKLMIPRGSSTAKDWIDDFDALQTTVMGARVSDGFWRGIAAVQDQLDAQLA